MQGVTETCSECAFDPRAVGDEQLGPELVRLADGYQGVLADAGKRELSALDQRPAPEVWSILEYTGHVLFLYEMVSEMCGMMAGEDDPAINGVDPDEHVLESRFNEVDAAEMAERIGTAGERARAALAGLEAGVLDQPLKFNGNPVPLRLMTVAMVHESHHHLGDVTGLLQR